MSKGRRVECHRCTAKRPKSEERRAEELGGESEREEVGCEGGRGRGEEMPPQATVCKIVAEMKAGSPVDRFIISPAAYSPMRKNDVSKLLCFTHRRRLPNPCAKRCQLCLGDLKKTLHPIKHMSYNTKI